MQCHLNGFVAVLVVHEVDDVQGGDILGSQPVHEVIQTIHDFVVIQDIALDRRSLRTDLHLQLLVHTAVDGVQHGLGQVGASTEELHHLTNDHRGDAASDGIVIVVEVGTHQIVVFVLYGRGIDRNLGTELLEAHRQLFRPQDGHVWLR